MFTVYYTLIGIAAFFIAALVLGAWLRGHRTKENAERSTIHRGFQTRWSYRSRAGY